MSEVKITPLPNGPYLVTGVVKLVDSEGNQIEIEREKMALCRCGASATKPFCDGTYVSIGFKSEAAESEAA